MNAGIVTQLIICWSLSGYILPLIGQVVCMASVSSLTFPWRFWKNTVIIFQTFSITLHISSGMVRYHLVPTVVELESMSKACGDGYLKVTSCSRQGRFTTTQFWRLISNPFDRSETSWDWNSWGVEDHTQLGLISALSSITATMKHSYSVEFYLLGL
jgi:hypothetical protein